VQPGNPSSQARRTSWLLAPPRKVNPSHLCRKLLRDLKSTDYRPTPVACLFPFWLSHAPQSACPESILLALLSRVDSSSPPVTQKISAKPKPFFFSRLLIRTSRLFSPIPFADSPPFPHHWFFFYPLIVPFWKFSFVTEVGVLQYLTVDLHPVFSPGYFSFSSNTPCHLAFCPPPFLVIFSPLFFFSTTFPY